MTCPTCGADSQRPICKLTKSGMVECCEHCGAELEPEASMAVGRSMMRIFRINSTAPKSVSCK